MSKIIIADTSCLTALNNIGELSLLKLLFKPIIITPDVKGEYGSEIY